MVREHRFRDDLLFRLNVLQLRVPALAERLQDIEDLAYTLHAKLSRKHHRAFPPLRPGHVELLQTYHWPGNVRQLQTILERALLLGMLDRLGALIDEERRLYGETALPAPSHASFRPSLDSSPSPLASTSGSPDDVIPMREVNRRYVETALRALDNNQARTARRLGISVNRLKRILSDRTPLESGVDPHGGESA